MKPEFTLSPTLQTQGVQDVQTDMLMLTKIQGMGLGAGPRAVDEKINGKLTQLAEAKGFTGAANTHVSVHLGKNAPQKHLVLVGLGPAASFNHCALVQAIEKAIDKAVRHKCKKLTIPVVANRMTALSLSLRYTAKIVRLVAERRLAAVEGDDVLEIQFLCTRQAAHHIKNGLALAEPDKSICACEGM